MSSATSSRLFEHNSRWNLSAAGREVQKPERNFYFRLGSKFHNPAHSFPFKAATICATCTWFNSCTSIILELRRIYGRFVEAAGAAVWLE